MDHPGKSSHCVVFTDVRLIQNGTQQSPKQLDTVHHVSTAKIVVVASVPNGLSFSTHTAVILTNVIWEKLKHLLWNSASLEEKTKEAVTFNIKSPFLYFFFSLLSRFQVEGSLKFAENLYPQDLSPVYLTGWFPLDYPCIPACSQKQDSTHWAKCLLCHKLAFKKPASQRKGT